LELGTEGRNECETPRRIAVDLFIINELTNQSCLRRG
jgi:hypothetical protein